jgi:MYXO-CTERM domain-containing protein
MSPAELLLALAPTIASPTSVPEDEPTELVDLPEYAMPIDGGRMPTGELTDEPRTKPLGAKVLFVNFDGGQMNFCGNDDPHGDCSTIFGGVVLPYSGDAVKRATVIQVIRKRVADFGISVTDVRPASGDYDMEMVGNWQGEQPGFAGIAPNIDCFDNDGGETSFTLEASQSADGIAEIVLQELAHTWGLEHVDEGVDLLFPTTSGSNKTFTDECHKIVEDTMLNPSGGICNSVHTEFCDSGWQNSYQELLFVFGESVPDTAAPTVEILAPADGETVAPDFDILIGFADDQQPVVIEATITIASDALPEPVSSTGAYAGPSELTFPVDGLPVGEYTITVEGLDESMNPASDEITVVVDDPASADESEGGDDDGPSTATDAGSTDGGDDGNDDGDDDDGDGSSGGAGADAGEGPSDRGCACAAALEPAPAAAFGLLLVALFGRRRGNSSPVRS